MASVELSDHDFHSAMDLSKEDFHNFLENLIVFFVDVVKKNKQLKHTTVSSNKELTAIVGASFLNNVNFIKFFTSKISRPKGLMISPFSGKSFELRDVGRSIVNGAALGGHRELCLMVHELFHPSVLTEMIENAAFFGSLEICDDALHWEIEWSERHSSNEMTDIMLNDMLIGAAKGGQKEICREAIIRGAKGCFREAAENAAMINRCDIIEMLLEPIKRDVFFWERLCQIAVDFGFPDLASFVVQHSPEQAQELHRRAIFNSDIIENASKRGFDRKDKKETNDKIIAIALSTGFVPEDE